MTHVLSPDPKQPPLFGTTGFVVDAFGGVHFYCPQCRIQILYPEMPREEVKAWCCGRWVYLIPRED